MKAIREGETVSVCRRVRRSGNSAGEGVAGVGVGVAGCERISMLVRLDEDARNDVEETRRREVGVNRLRRAFQSCSWLRQPSKVRVRSRDQSTAFDKTVIDKYTL